MFFRRGIDLLLWGFIHNRRAVPHAMNAYNLLDEGVGLQIQQMERV
jgi:hypothetical protein